MMTESIEAGLLSQIPLRRESALLRDSATSAGVREEELDGQAHWLEYLDLAGAVLAEGQISWLLSPRFLFPSSGSAWQSAAGADYTPPRRVSDIESCPTICPKQLRVRILARLLHR